MRDDIDDYLRKAAEAETLAKSFEDAYLRACWMAIADGYRALAEEDAKSATATPRNTPPPN